MGKDNRQVFIAVPAQDELDYLPAMLECVKNQTLTDFELVICVNQPDDWWDRDDKKEICESNRKCLDYLNAYPANFKRTIIDRSSPGNGWKGKKQGVGQARKVLMDSISERAKATDILISLDADTTFHPAYFQSVLNNFEQNPKAVALSVPYYHLLTGHKMHDRAILHYEIYMRYYAINLWRINNPYAFTAIGSAIALPIQVFRAIGGITPHQSGEDFYFLQKLRKYGYVLTHNDEKVYPASRLSSRVGFGTGPAMIKGSQGNWDSYPIYPSDYFDEVRQTYDLFESCFEQDVKTPMDDFIIEKFGSTSIWQSLRENARTVETFKRACTHKMDAFRILQFLKWRHIHSLKSDEENLIAWFNRYYPNKVVAFKQDLTHLSFASSSIAVLDKIRNALVEIEENFQKHATSIIPHP